MSLHCQPYHRWQDVAMRNVECGLRTSTLHRLHALAISLLASILSTASDMENHICKPKNFEGKEA
jgi:hypothetical protein